MKIQLTGAAAVLAALAAGCSSQSSTSSAPVTVSAVCGQSVALNAPEGAADCDLWPSQSVYVKDMKLELDTPDSTVYVTEAVNRQIPAADPKDSDGTTVSWMIPKLAALEADHPVSLSPVSWDGTGGGGMFIATTVPCCGSS